MPNQAGSRALRHGHAVWRPSMWPILATNNGNNRDSRSASAIVRGPDFHAAHSPNWTSASLRRRSVWGSTVNSTRRGGRTTRVPAPSTTAVTSSSTASPSRGARPSSQRGRTVAAGRMVWPDSVFYVNQLPDQPNPAVAVAVAMCIPAGGPEQFGGFSRRIVADRGFQGGVCDDDLRIGASVDRKRAERGVCRSP